MPREQARRGVHQIGLAEIGGGEEIEVEPRLARKVRRKWLVEVDRDPEAAALGGDLHAIGEVDRLVVGSHDELVGLGPARPADERGDLRPLLGRLVEPDRTVGRNPVAVEDDLDPGVLLVEEDRAELVLVDDDRQALRLQRFGRGDDEAAVLRLGGHGGRTGDHGDRGKQRDNDSFRHEHFLASGIRTGAVVRSGAGTGPVTMIGKAPHSAVTLNLFQGPPRDGLRARKRRSGC
ncbi:hypothetical protein [Sphingomonas sp. PAMC 26621]|uniref:hypothetical protein n=1 Tax=Sphingomonas sp. PAMC 26621 TaxID=1112213 RepID=UPI001EE658D5|nr:hypothetical protein [Sphingomonas sp. PAMC 26621]